MLCQNITILSKTCLLKLSNRETGAASLCLFSSLYCCVWIHICSNSAIRMYWMSVCPCFCVFGADFEQTCISQILCVKSLVFHSSVDIKLYDFYTCQYAFFCHSRENFAFDSRLRVLYKKWLLWAKSNLWSRQDDTVEFYSYSEYLCMWKIFYSVQYFSHIASMLAMFGQFFVSIFSRQATYLRYIWQHILSTFVIYYMHCTSTLPAYLII